jgi:hypothetical protein
MRQFRFCPFQLNKKPLSSHYANPEVYQIFLSGRLALSPFLFPRKVILGGRIVKLKKERHCIASVVTTYNQPSAITAAFATQKHYIIEGYRHSEVRVLLVPYHHLTISNSIFNIRDIESILTSGKEFYVLIRGK